MGRRDMSHKFGRICACLLALTIFCAGCGGPRLVLEPLPGVEYVHNGGGEYLIHGLEGEYLAYNLRPLIGGREAEFLYLAGPTFLDRSLAALEASAEWVDETGTRLRFGYTRDAFTKAERRYDYTVDLAEKTVTVEEGEAEFSDEALLEMATTLARLLVGGRAAAQGEQQT